MIKFFKYFYNVLGNNKSQRFRRLLLLLALIGLIVSSIINFGYDKGKGGFYWKPADISINKAIN